MLPDYELNAFLIAGLERAQLIEEDGVEWGAELAERYRLALTRFEERWDGEKA